MIDSNPWEKVFVCVSKTKTTGDLNDDIAHARMPACLIDNRCACVWLGVSANGRSLSPGERKPMLVLDKKIIHDNYTWIDFRLIIRRSIDSRMMNHHWWWSRCWNCCVVWLRQRESGARAIMMMMMRHGHSTRKTGAGFPHRDDEPCGFHHHPSISFTYKVKLSHGIPHAMPAYDANHHHEGNRIEFEWMKETEVGARKRERTNVICHCLVWFFDSPMGWGRLHANQMHTNGHVAIGWRLIDCSTFCLPFSLLHV